MVIDLRLMAFATLGKKLEKTLNNNETKKAIRNGDVIYKFADYYATGGRVFGLGGTAAIIF